MKPPYISISFATLMVASMLFASHYKAPIKYSQIFAEKKIVLTEELSPLDAFLIRNKNGFVQYEN